MLFSLEAAVRRTVAGDTVDDNYNSRPTHQCHYQSLIAHMCVEVCVSLVFFSEHWRLLPNLNRPIWSSLSQKTHPEKPILFRAGADAVSASGRSMQPQTKRAISWYIALQPLAEKSLEDHQFQRLYRGCCWLGVAEIDEERHQVCYVT